MDCSPPDFSVHEDSPGRNTGVGCHGLLQGIFPIQGSNPGLLHWGLMLYHLSHQGSPRILEWVAYPFSRGSSGPCNQSGVSCIAGIFLPAKQNSIFLIGQVSINIPWSGITMEKEIDKRVQDRASGRECLSRIESFIVSRAISVHYCLRLPCQVSSSHQVAKVFELQLQYQSFQWMFRTDFF